MKNHSRKSLKWYNDLLKGKVLKKHFNIYFLSALLLALFGGKIGLKIVVISIGLLFFVLGVGRGQSAYNLFSKKDYLSCLFMVLFAGLLISAGVSTVIAAFVKINT